jgi:flavin reductase (DIM6/NTAB) family NADH-FMN oxidoreductase RutF
MLTGSAAAVRLSGSVSQSNDALHWRGGHRRTAWSQAREKFRRIHGRPLGEGTGNSRPRAGPAFTCYWVAPRTEASMEDLPISRAFTLIEPGPVVLITTHDGRKDNVMTISWTMVLGFSAAFAVTTGPWNYSYAALQKTKECVIAIPTVDLIDTAVGVGTCSGRDVEKFEKFRLTRAKAKHVHPPLIKDCVANIECRVVDMIDRYNIVILEGVAAYFDSSRKERRILHAIGDGTFVVDGRKFDRKEMMRAKLPRGL